MSLTQFDWANELRLVDVKENPPAQYVCFSFQRIGLRESLQETPLFHGKIDDFL